MEPEAIGLIMLAIITIYFVIRNRKINGKFLQ